LQSSIGPRPRTYHEQVPPPVDILEIDRADQLKALGHPLRLRVLELLGEHETELTNRELADRLGVDPGHLHFHVRMLLGAGLIERAAGGKGREKPYRAVAARITVAPDLIATGDADDARAAMLADVRRAHVAFTTEGRFRSSQVNVRIAPEQFLEAWREFVDRVASLEDLDHDPLTITMFWHPSLRADTEAVSDGVRREAAAS
jgi:DNA-binding transcriptional ArsR family regulator